MANIYETTYSSTFSRPAASRAAPAYRPPRSRNSIYVLESPLRTDPLPPLDAPPPQDYQTRSASQASTAYRPTVQRSGFWCENPQERMGKQATEMRTTNQEAFSPPQRFEFTNRFQPHKVATPYAREPIMVRPEEAEYRTTNQDTFKRVSNRAVPMPGNVVMEPTGFQRGSDGSITIGSKERKKLSQIEIERMKTKDPVGYLGAKADDDPYISMSQLCYQPPSKPRPFPRR